MLHLLIDAEVLDEDLPIRYIARDGQQNDGVAHIRELVSGPDGNLCRLRGVGAPLSALLADDPKKV